MHIDDVNMVGVVGCGLMGSGIVEVCARAGFAVVVREVDETLLKQGLGRVSASLARSVQRKRLAQSEMDATLGRIQGTVALEDFADCDLVIEAALEIMGEKRAVFAALDRITRPEAVLASNTSSLSITEMAAATRRPERVAGLHFFNPVPAMPLIEIVRGLRTSDETVELGRALGVRLHKTTIVAPDRPGFIVNLLLIPYLLDAVRAVENGVATKEDIDAGIRLGLNHPMGPITLLDFVGLDTTLFIADAMHAEFRDPRYAAPPLLRRMVAAGLLGRKSGQGFYDYGEQ